MGRDEGDAPAKDESWAYFNRAEKKLLGSAIIFGVMGAAITTFAVTHMKKTLDSIYSQWSRYQASFKSNSSSWSTFQEEARKRYQRRLQEELEEEMERVERIRRMQSVFNRERNKFKRNYDSWQQYGPSEFHEHFQRHDWYWNSDTSSKDHGSTPGTAPRATLLSQHYSVLGLDRRRTKPYTDAEIKSAFREKAKEFHPDQNQHNKELAEAKFKEVMTSYEAIKSERKKDGLR